MVTSVILKTGALPLPTPVILLNRPTEEYVCMQLTVPHHIDNVGTNVEEQAGTGECDAPGG